ncbi:MAG: hypothetical protein NC218_00530 [Acetobacter sp.]|nr:hypothetical protein [Acetobacter sp.]
MKKILMLIAALMFNACTTKYILMDEEGNPVDENYYTEGTLKDSNISERALTANDVFVVNEGESFVTYQYKSVRVDEISPLASLYCADIALGASPYLREVNMYHNGFMRATFDCVNLAI